VAGSHAAALACQRSDRAVSIDTEQLKQADWYSRTSEEELSEALSKMTVQSADVLVSIANTLLALYHLERAKIGHIAEPVE
jgi:hypothetical protein